MVIPGVHLAASWGVAKRQRKHAEPAVPNGTALMCLVVCDQCGECFEIRHTLATQDSVLAGRQATWLADKFVWDHIQESHHQHSIDLPAADAIK